MEPKKLTIGCKGSPRVVIEWLDEYPSQGPVGKTWGNIQLWIEDTLVWGYLDPDGNTKGIRWSWIELLEFLGNSWPYIVEEEQCPIIFDNNHSRLNRLSDLWGNFKLRLRELKQDEINREDAMFRDFLMVHDFSESLYGASVPKLLFLRRGSQMLVATQKQEWILSFSSSLDMLKQLGDAILSRLDDLSDKRSIIARERWEKRELISDLQRWHIATGIDSDKLIRVIPFDVESIAANDRFYQIKAAARMLNGQVPESELGSLLKTIYDLKPSLSSITSDWIEDVMEDARNVLNDCASWLPAIQGYQLANMIREKAGNLKDQFDLDELMRNFCVSIKEINISTRNLDAIAVWGGCINPTVLLNTSGFRYSTGRRSTLAHEMCHILADREGALPAIEVLGGETPLSIEQRADAFAAELLLPRTEAALLFLQELKYITNRSERDKGINRVIDEISKKFGVSHEMAAWQIINSGVEMDQNDEAELRKKQKSLINRDFKK